MDTLQFREALIESTIVRYHPGLAGALVKCNRKLKIGPSTSGKGTFQSMFQQHKGSKLHKEVCTVHWENKKEMIQILL
jgi:hypothetical protein